VAGEVVVDVKATTADFEKAIAKAEKEVMRFDKEATEAAAGALKLGKAATEAAKAATKLKTEAAGSAKSTTTLRKGATAAAKEAKALKTQVTAAAKAAKALEKDAKSSAKGTAALKAEAQAAAVQVNVLRTAEQEAAREARVLRKAAEDSAKGTAVLKKEAGEAAKKARALKIGATSASKGARTLTKRSKDAAREVKKLRVAAAKAKPALNGIQRALKKSADAAALLTGPLGGIASRLSVLGRVASVGGAALLAFSVAVGTLTFGLTAAITESEKFERSGFRVQAVLEATGSSAGFTAKEIRGLSKDIARTTLATSQGVEATAAKLLTFRSIQGDVFTEALQLSQDLAETGFGSIEGAAVQLGKALEDPIAGVSALKEVGVSFSPVQKEQIRQFIELNQLAKAQAVILEVLSGQVGDVGVKAAEGLTGSYNKLNFQISEFLQDMGNAGLVQEMSKVVKNLATEVELLNGLFFKTDADKLTELMDQRADADRTSRLGIQGISQAAALRVDSINQEINALKAKENVEKKASAAAKAAAAISARQAVEDARLSKVLEAQATERERLKKLRESTTRGITEEIAVLTAVSAAYADSSVSAREFAKVEERITLLTKLNLEATSKEGEAISKLVAERTQLAEALAQERAEREQSAATEARLRSLQAEIVVVETLTASIGKSTAQVREARIEAKAHRIEQEMTAAALQKQGELTVGQTAAIRQQSQAIAETTVRLEDLRTVQNQTLAAEEEANAKRLEFQQTVASGITDLVFETESLEDALKSMVLQLSRAIVEAKTLEAIQFASGTNAGGGGNEGGFINAIAGFFTSATSSNTGTTTATQMHQGGRVGLAGRQVSVPSSNFINAPRFHEGLRPDEFPAILQRGEDVIPKDQVGERQSGVRDVTFNITTPDADSFRKSKRQVSREFRRATAAT